MTTKLFDGFREIPFNSLTNVRMQCYNKYFFYLIMMDDQKLPEYISL